VENFAQNALHNGVETSQMSVARYVLCTVVDEAVVTTAWGKESDWSQMSLLSRFHNETSGGEKFFHLLERMSKNPAKHLPTLELMYLCLALGFEGKYRIQPRGLLELENLRDALYRQIRHLRPDVPRESPGYWVSSAPVFCSHSVSLTKLRLSFSCSRYTGTCDEQILQKNRCVAA
jgi:type VI secretion system protein ImpK